MKSVRHGPVFIMDRERPSHVLLTIEDYRKITQSRATIADLPAMPGVEDIDFETSRVGDPSRAAELD